MLKWLSELVPFLSPYPTWVKLLLSGWVLLTGACVIALVLAAPSPAPTVAPLKAVSAQRSNGTWLALQGVEVFDGRWRGAGVRVIANVNGNTYLYPSVAGVSWIVAGPDMSSGLFRLPQSETYHITFTLDAKHQGEDAVQRFVSQREVVKSHSALPYSDLYNVHPLGEEGFRGISIGAQISFLLSDQPP